MPLRYPPAAPWLRIAAIGGAAAALIGALALMATPRGDDTAGIADERTAIALLRDLAMAEAQFAADLRIDADSDGRGEFGYLAELAGSARLRIDAAGRIGRAAIGQPLVPPSPIFGSAADNGSYVVQVFLPGNDGEWIAESAEGGGAGAAVAVDRAEQQFRAYAWPTIGTAARRAFAIDESGTVRAFANVDRRYLDRPHPVAADAVDRDAADWVPLR